MGNKTCNSPLQTAVRQPASQQAATAVFQLPGAPGMQRDPRRAAAQACVREQRALSVPKKQPRGDFHPIGLNATAAGGARQGLQREPRVGALHGSTERTLCYEVLCSVKPHSAWASLCTASKKGTETDWRWKRGKKREEKERVGVETVLYLMLTEVKGTEIKEWDWSQTWCFYLYSQDAFSKLCCQTEKKPECWTGNHKNLIAVHNVF